MMSNNLSNKSSFISIKAIDHLVLRANNVSVLVEFYSDVLGCSIERELPDKGLTQLRAGSSLIDIIAVDSELGQLGGAGPGQDAHNLDHFCLTIEAVSEQSLLDYLKEQGVRCGKFAERYGAQGYGRSLYLKDPAGNTVELKYQKT